MIQRFHKFAPVFIGAALFSAIAAISSCERRQTPQWEFPTTTTSPADSVTFPKQISEGKGFRFLSYNLKNWLSMDRNGTIAPKPEHEKMAIVSLISRQQPDVLGVCEIGTPDDLKELQQRLKTAGLDFPYFVHHGGSDPVRRLGLLSKFPILKTAVLEKTHYQLAGKTHAIQRGVLDATLEISENTYRFLGLHLKSRRETDDADQSQMRLEEARLIRSHADQIFTENPSERLIVYGDFNDTRDSMPLKILVGENHAATRLAPLPLKDSQKLSWTYFWSVPETYSRIDFVLSSAQISFNPEESGIVDDPDWLQASDHRPLLIRFR